MTKAMTKAMTSDQDDDNTHTQSLALKISLLFFVLNVVVYASSSFEQFDALGLGSRWQFHEMFMWSSLATVATLVSLMLLTCCAVISEKECCAVLTQALAILFAAGMVAITVASYVMMGTIWNQDPKHTIFFYGPFWNEGATPPHGPFVDMGPKVAPLPLCADWLYTMSDVVIRLHAFLMMLLPVIIGIGAVCTCCVKACMA